MINNTMFELMHILLLLMTGALLVAQLIAARTTHKVADIVKLDEKLRSSVFLDELKQLKKYAQDNSTALAALATEIRNDLDSLHKRVEYLEQRDRERDN